MSAVTEPLRDDVGAVLLPRDVLAVRGPDAVTFLQGQLAQDVAALAHGASADSLLLQPTGKVDALLRITRTGEEEVVLDVDGGHGDAVAARLARFRLRVKADIEPLPWRCVALRGPRAHDVADAAVVTDAGGLALPADWP
nr:hypothetical protein [Acidimicrobiia bacterium]